MATEWFVRFGGNEVGPYSSAQLRKLAEEGRISREAEVRKGSDGTWIPAAKVAGLLAAEAGSPPAVPPVPAASAPPPMPVRPVVAAAGAQAAGPNAVTRGPLPPYIWAVIGGAVVLVIGGACLALFSPRAATTTVAANPAQPSANTAVAATATPTPAEPEPPAKAKRRTTSKRKTPAKDLLAGDQAGDADEPAEEPKKTSKKRAPRKKSTTTTAKKRSSGPLSGEEIVALAEKSVALIQGKSSSGSGFVIRKGLVATNRHVVAQDLPDSFKIQFPSADKSEAGPYSAMLVYEDPKHDLAFLATDAPFEPLAVAENHRFRRGEDVVAIGSPGLFGGHDQLQNAVNKGILSTEKTVDGRPYYQLGISINRGNSGGPVLDTAGEVIGVVTLKSKVEEGLAFCVPAAQILAALHALEGQSEQQIEKTGAMHRLQVLFLAVAKRGSIYKGIVQVLVERLDDAVDEGATSKEVMQWVRKNFPEKIRAIDDDEQHDLKREMASIANDSKLPAAPRKQLSDLWTNYLDLKSNLETPRGSLSQFKAKCHELSGKHDKLVHALELALDVDAEN